MAKFALKCQSLARGLSSANVLVKTINRIFCSHFFQLKCCPITVNNSRNCSYKGSHNCDCKQEKKTEKDPRDTDEECEFYKKLMATNHIENSCRQNQSSCKKHVTVCDPIDCELKKIEESSPIPKDVFQQDPPCIPFEHFEDNHKNKCELAELKKCKTENPKKAHQCTSEKPKCFSSDKTYPMKHAGLKPEIDGRPIIGESWKRKSWGIKC